VPQTAATAPSSGRRWTKRALAVLAVLGPGLIAANAGNDAGGILTYASAGSQFGYRTLFLMVLVTVALVVVQEMCSRLGFYTGEGLGGLIREQFSARSTFGALSLLLIANAGLTVSEFAGVGAAMQIFGISPLISVPIAAVFVWALTVSGLLLARRAALPGADAGVPGLPDRRVPRPPQRQTSPHQPRVAPLPRHARVPAARRGLDRHHHHPLHAVLRRLGLRGHGHQIRHTVATVLKMGPFFALPSMVDQLDEDQHVGEQQRGDDAVEHLGVDDECDQITGGASPWLVCCRLSCSSKPCSAWAERARAAPMHARRGLRCRILGAGGGRSREAH
jgi:hypothetical protein